MPEHQQTQKSTDQSPLIRKQATPRIQAPSSHPMDIIQRARMNPKSLTHADVMQLQQTIGNRAVVRLLSEIRAIPSKAKQAPPVQRQELVQRPEIPEEEEPLQGNFESGPEKETCPSCMQRQEIPQEEEPLQTKSENNTGMPDNLKAGVENLSGIDMSDVRVHYNSSKPAEVGALAYAQGTNIHVAPGQERHLPHEAWHVVQQAQGRVKPTMQMKDGIPVNDDEGLEHEADMMHEAAHLVQQRKVVQLKGWIGEGWNAYEQQTDRVKDLVMQGQSTKELFGVQISKGTLMASDVEPIQRMINYTSTSKRFKGMVINDRKSLIAAIVTIFPLLTHAKYPINGMNVEGVINAMEQRGNWSLSDVYSFFSRWNRQVPVPLGESEENEEILLPSKEADRKYFGFTTRTRARGFVEQKDGKKVPLPEVTQDEDEHAEDKMMKELNGMITRGEIDPKSDTIVITINNSPCYARCSKNLSAWKTKNWPSRFVIYYANPHGTVKEFIEARQRLRMAGVEMKSFDPVLSSTEMGSLTRRQQKGLIDMKKHRKQSRQSWNKEHPSDESSDTEGEVEKEKPTVPGKRRRDSSSSNTEGKLAKKPEGPEVTEYETKVIDHLLRTNNCLINAIARPVLGRNATFGELVTIRGALLERGFEIGEMLVASPDILNIIRRIFHTERGIRVVYQNGDPEDQVLGPDPIVIYHIINHFQERLATPGVTGSGIAL